METAGISDKNGKHPNATQCKIPKQDL